MSGFGGFGGFGQNNNQNTGGGFGGFGQSNTNNTSGGFGSSNTNTGFGSGGSLFGNNNNTTTNTATGFGGFGSSGGAFGQNKTGFGSTTATSGGGLFGGGTATSGGFGGFGGTNTTGGFGSSTSGGGGLFGQQNKPSTGFGGSGGGGSLFGGSNTTGGFGNSTATTGNTGFGGFGGSTSAQNNGTGTVPFQEVTEKDANAAGNQINKFQSITTQDAYKGFSFEELRTVDYQQNRKQGSANGQAGSFGAGSTFGGFGGNTNTSTTGGFGSSNTGGGLFGQTNTNTSTGFGSSNTGGLFGAKPAAGGLFGSSTATSAPSGGGLFGTSNTTGGFGSGFGSNTTSTATTSGLFGTANQAKPAFGGFGSNTNTGGFGSSTAGGFGSGTQTSTGGGGLFGNNAAASTGFGNNQQSGSTGFSFGQQNTQANQQPAQTGGLFGSGGFGQSNQQKPGGLFGSTTTPATGGGLFGNSNQTQQSGGLFGNSNAQTQQSGGLFGNKPATGGLFGNTNTGATGGGLFGNNNQQPAQSGGLFGSTNTQQSGGLFGNKPATGGGLFGNTQNNQPAQNSSLFGNSQQNAQPSGGSLFGNSLLAPQAPQQPGTLTASLLQNPYGNDALFANIGTPTQSVGPLATPLASSQKNKKQTMLPAYKVNPAASGRLTTPQKRPAGYGFSYSTYGTPGSAIAGSPFGFSNALSPAFGRSLNKSMSTSNLRNSFSADESILNPNAFSSTVRGGTGRLKKLNVDRSLNSARKSLFSAAPDRTKSVSFTPDSKGANGSLDSMSGALVRTESPTEIPPEANGDFYTNGTSGRSNDLGPIDEHSSTESAPAVKPPIQVPRSHADQAPGGYWSKPTIDEIKAMPRSEAQNYKDFKVGCKNSGEITFSQVDLTSIPLDKLFGDLVDFETRKVSVYGAKTTVPKPPQGQGLNVPSLITLANSWPRSNAGATEVLEKKGMRFEKHVNRLKRIPDTEFIKYDANTGEWTFRVQHYTTYGLPDDDEDESMLDDSMLSPNMASPTPLKVAKLREQLSSPNGHSDASLPSPPDSSPDDTFDFKKGKRKHLPGQFDDDLMEDDVYEEEEEVTGSLSFLGQRSVGSSVADAEDADELGLAEGQEMAGSFPLPSRTTEHSTAVAQIEPKSILKNSIMAGTPLKTGSCFFGDDWTEQLQRTVSPKKQDRAALRANQSVAFKSPEQEPAPKAIDRKQPFATSMDIMDSLFNQSTRSNASPAKFGGGNLGTEYPSKRVKVRDADESKELEKAFHQTSKAQWGSDGTLVYLAGPMRTRLGDKGVLEKFSASIVGEHNDVRFAKLASYGQEMIPPPTLLEQQDCTDITYEKGSEVPHATTNSNFEFIQFAEAVVPEELSDRMEQRAWELGHILFDAPRDVPATVAASEKEQYQLRSLKDKVSEFWKKIVRNDVQLHVARAESQEEKAFAYLTGGLIEEACNTLVEAKNFHLATLVAQIGCDRKFRSAMSVQLENWRSLNTLAEFEDSIRGIYELLAGNTCICRGQAAAGTENVTSTFSFATRFNLDWRRSFGLRLWYGIDPEQGIEEAVMQYLQDVKDGSEEVKPVPWFIEQRLAKGEVINSINDREDLLWSLLQLYAGDSFDLAAAFAPESVSGNSMDARLSFQLITLFQARAIGDLPAGIVDALAATYAADLATAIEKQPQALLSAVWVLLHVSDANARELDVRALLDRHAALIESPEDKIFVGLRELRIPDNWMYLAKALYARAVLQDPVAEAQHLLEAGDWTQAHEVVCRTVGPLAVIENDADQLRELLGGLHEPVRKGSRYADAWERGAGLYYDFVEMRDLETQKGQRWKELVGRVSRALQRVHTEGRIENKELRERAALHIMGNVTAECVAELQTKEKSHAPEVPQTEDKFFVQGKQLEVEYFRALVSAS